MNYFITKKETFKVPLSYFILGDTMFRNKPFFTIVIILFLSVLIFYQILITLLLPLRINIILLMIECFLLFYFLFRLFWR